MAKFHVEVDLKNLKRFARKLPSELDRACKKTLRDIDKRAMQILDSSRGTGFTGQKWSPSREGSIADSKNITVSHFGNTTIGKLEYTSPHARIVEYGGLGKTLVSETTPFPIGASQGRYPIFSQKIRLQRGYLFLTKSFYDSQTDRMLNKNVLKAIRRARRVF